MNKVKVLFVFGTRPEVVKMMPIINVMRRQQEFFQIRICVTAQHRQMLDNLLSLFGIDPDYDLDLMQDDQEPSHLCAYILERLDPLLLSEKPDWLLVQGDTTTAMAASVAGYHRKIKVGHVEAGLRTSDKYQPFPEEINRRIISTIAELHFAPSETAKQNLLREGIDEQKIAVTGNTVIDALLQVIDTEDDYDIEPFLPKSVLSDKRVLLITAHRRENFGEPIREICLALRTIAELYQNNVHIVYPVHLNPNIWEPVHEMLDGMANITLTEPLDYICFTNLMNRCHIVLTDSGGLQEEAPSLGKPVLVLRNTTERPEAVEAGTARLVGTSTTRIVNEVSRLLDDSDAYNEMVNAVNPYGDGHAAERICEGVLVASEEKVTHVC